MRVVIKNDYDECSKWVARYIAKKINAFKPRGKKNFVLGLPTGSTPLGTYAELIKIHRAKKISFKDVVTFNMDEYVGLAKAHPQSYHYFMHENFFKSIDIKKENAHILDGCAKDKERECADYEKAIAAAGGIDLFLGGVGSDGHIAFNEPTSSLASRTREAYLTQETIIANSRFFGGDIKKVPKSALTVGVGTIFEADEVLIVATGAAKAAAVHHAVEGSVSQMWTISVLQMHPNAILVCDEDATSDLRVGTARYFKEIEARRRS